MRKKLRRGAILALVLVLLFSNTVGATGNTVEEEPDVIVNNYGELYTAYTEAENGAVIGIKNVINIPTLISFDTKYVTFKRMGAGAKLLFSGSYDAEAVANVSDITFDGNARNVGGLDPFVVVAGNVVFTSCDFSDCFYQNGNGGALYIGSGEVEVSSCKFESNSAYNGSHIYNDGTLNINH